ncbi:MAG: putative ATPase [Candidatus Eremiobacteraeota bacterium]|nr:putative ATPase [Candidatus Eremiobacteraeota bacterium]
MSDAFARNRAQMLRALERLRTILESRGGGTAPPLVLDEESALARIRTAFGLTPFETDVLVLAAAPELDGEFAALLAGIAGDRTATQPTFSLALATLPQPAWSAILPDAPLRRWRLVTIGSGSPTAAPLRADEAIVHALLGFPFRDERARSFSALLAPPPIVLSATQEAVARAAADALLRAARPVIQLVCADALLARAIAAEIVSMLDRHGLAVRAAALSTLTPDVLDALAIWERAAILTGAVTVLECDDVDDPQRERTIDTIVEHAAQPLIVVTRARMALAGAAVPAFEASRPSPEEQAASWAAALAPSRAPAESRRLAAQFDLDLATIGAVAAGVAEDAPFADLWDAARAQARPRLNALAERIDTSAGWRDLVLPPDRRKTLRTIVDAVRQRDRVYREWGFARTQSDARGTTVLFAGPSGTGKSLAARVLARALKLDLYRIDLAAVFSKYIGETEKNLRRIFDAAEAGGVVLLFDEADALFGKRSEVKDSHDRHANVEVSYLLQRLERFNGVAVLTSNLRDAFDNAFLRRFAFVIEFPFPDASARERIWRRAFPAATPTEALDYAQLGRLALPGGNIRTIALNAAVRAAARDRRITMRDVADAARIEYAKIGHGHGEADLLRWLEAV